MRQQTLRKAITVLGISVALFSAKEIFCRSARAAYGPMDALETVGISTGIGTVIGFSTISFYEKPTSHMKNAFIGAGLGAILGIGVAAYLLASTPPEDEISPEELLPPENRPETAPPKSSEATIPGTSLAQAGARQDVARQFGSWAVAFQVLELRF